MKILDQSISIIFYFVQDFLEFMKRSLTNTFPVTQCVVIYEAGSTLHYYVVRFFRESILQDTGYEMK